VLSSLGDAAFLAGLRSYVQTVYLGVGYPEQFYAAMQAQTGVSLAPLFCQNVGIMC
jgi:cobyrinic acid a,c-diamide synthase